MIDLSYFQNSKTNVQAFVNAGTWQTWIKPRNAKFVNILCIGAGGGGGAGYYNPPTGNAGGGGGGGGSNIANFSINATSLPDLLYVYPGIGGAGGTGGNDSNPATSGARGENSFVTIQPIKAQNTVVLRSGTTGAGGGAVGGTAGGAAGVGEVYNSVNSSTFTCLGNFTLTDARTGQAGNPNSNATPIIITTGGLGGGGFNSGINYAAGGWLANGVTPQVPAVAVGTSGRDGIIIYRPTLAFLGGTGAGASGPFTKGGDGAYGCGGGGGGGSNTTASGAGGKGGDGLIIIITSI